MKVLILCAGKWIELIVNAFISSKGYGTRLKRDIEASSESLSEFQHLLHLPKALLPLGRYPLLTHWMHVFQQVADSEALPLTLRPTLDRIYVITNDHFFPQFQTWAMESGLLREQHLIDDGTSSNETRLGTNADLLYALEQGIGMEEPLLVVAGDTLMLRDFDLTDFLKQYQASSLSSGESFVTYYTCTDSETRSSGIVELDPRTQRVCGLLEKPDPSTTPLRQACPCFYLFHPDCLQLLKEFCQEMKRNKRPLEEWDAAGKFIQWVFPKHPFKAYSLSGRLDVGNLASYKQARDYMQAREVGKDK